MQKTKLFIYGEAIQTETYNKTNIIKQLMQWYSANTDKDIETGKALC